MNNSFDSLDEATLRQARENEITLLTLDHKIIMMEARIKRKSAVYDQLCAESAARATELSHAEETLANMLAAQTSNETMIEDIRTMCNHFNQYQMQHLQSQYIQQQLDKERAAVIKTHEQDLAQWITLYESEPEVKKLRSLESRLAVEKTKFAQHEAEVKEMRANQRQHEAHFRFMEQEFIVEMIKCAFDNRDIDQRINHQTVELNSKQKQLAALENEQLQTQALFKKLTNRLHGLVDSASGLVFPLIQIENEHPKFDLSTKSSVEPDEASETEVIIIDEEPDVPETAVDPEVPVASDLNHKPLDAPTELTRELSSLSISFSSTQKKVHFEQLPDDPNPSNSGSTEPPAATGDETMANSPIDLDDSDSELLDDCVQEPNNMNSMVDFFNLSRDMQQSFTDTDEVPSSAKRPKISSDPVSRSTTMDFFNFDEMPDHRVNNQSSSGFNFFDENADEPDDDGFDFGEVDATDNQDMGNLF